MEISARFYCNVLCFCLNGFLPLASVASMLPYSIEGSLAVLKQFNVCLFEYIHFVPFFLGGGGRGHRRRFVLFSPCQSEENKGNERRLLLKCSERREEKFPAREPNLGPSACLTIGL